MNRNLLTVALLVFGVISCASSKRGVIPSSVSNVISDARSYIGTPYRYNGTSAKGMDCSGLTSVVFEQSNISLSRTAIGQSKQGRTIKLEDARPEDLIFFKKKGKVFHVGIVSKKSKEQLWIIHSSSSKGVVEQEVLSSSYWRPKLYIIKRIG